MNRWNIPDWLEKEVKKRDQRCIYCGIEFGKGKQSRKSMPTWEHIVNDARIITRNNIARCCFSCNSSKGAKELSIWLKSKFCLIKGISKDTIAEVAKKALIKPPQFTPACEVQTQHLKQKNRNRSEVPIKFDLNRLIEIDKNPYLRESDRGFVLLCTSDIENALTNVFQKWFESLSQLSNRDKKALFDFTGPLGSFSSKINLGKAMGFLSPRIVKDLHLIRKIRNIAAHSNSDFSLSEKNIQNMTAPMFAKDDIENNIQRYSIVKKGTKKTETISPIDYNESVMKGCGILRYDRVQFNLSVLRIKLDLTKATIVAGAVGPMVGELNQNVLAQIEKKH